MDTAISTASLAHGVPPDAVRAALSRWTGRTRVVATLLGRPASDIEAELEQLRSRGVCPDAALDSMVLG